MNRSVPAASPDAYVAALTGWRRTCVEELRATVRAAALNAAVDDPTRDQPR